MPRASFVSPSTVCELTIRAFVCYTTHTGREGKRVQYKKEAVREKILAAARKEYLTRGFRGGNIGVIAENAGVPVGNLYRYFEGKTGVLDAIVKPVYEALPKLVSDLQQVEVLDSATLQQIMPMLIERLLAFFETFGDDILILMDGCDGTRYDDFGKDLMRQVSGVVRRKLYPDSPGKEEEIIADAVGKAFCGSLFDMLRMGLDREQMQSVMERLIKFYFYEADKRK